MDRAHLIPKQRLKKLLPAKVGYLDSWEFGEETMREFVWHPDVWVWGCRKHHSAFDQKQLKVQRLHLPGGVERFAEHFGLGWSLDADYGERVET